MAESIIVTGVIDIDPDQREAAIAATHTVMEATRAEDGCELYVFSADTADQGRFYVSEQWRDQAAMDAHMASPHLAAFMGAMGEFGVKSASLTKWTGATAEKLM
ncbi:MAG: antibiotic biosynthesis monooxygenase [Actinomycetota bacterium]|nr:antibiotic biosynthesis monooxygenase [Acidimicrobiia bacterium]MDQ3294184.1 antibiotic biosynthesis monooxygenase [Actinomycetota bacterium]